MTSVISLLVLVLVAYCNSIPIGDHDFTASFPTPKKYEFTTDKTTMDDGHTTMHMKVRFEEESTDEPETHSPRSFGVESTDEPETHSPRSFGVESTDESETHSPRSFGVESTDEPQTHSPRSFRVESTDESETHSPRSFGVESTDEPETHSPRSFGVESTDEPETHSPRSFDEEQTTPHSGSGTGVFHPTTSTSDLSGHSSYEKDLSLTTMKPVDGLNKREDTTSSPDEGTDDGQSERELEEREFSEPRNGFMQFSTPLSSSFEHKTYTSEPSTSVDSFAKSTKFVSGGKTENFESKPLPSEMEFQHTTEIIPGKMTQTKFNVYDSNEPTKTTAGEKQPITKTQKSDY
jgi:hypothetical protein